MGKKIEVEIEREPYEILKAMAKLNNLDLDQMIKHILQEFTQQGDVYTGSWPEGPGIRIIIDYPKYTSRVIKLYTSEIEKDDIQQDIDEITQEEIQ